LGDAGDVADVDDGGAAVTDGAAGTAIKSINSGSGRGFNSVAIWKRSVFG
jgi:hypothetical protein